MSTLALYVLEQLVADGDTVTVVADQSANAFFPLAEEALAWEFRKRDPEEDE